MSLRESCSGSTAAKLSLLYSLPQASLPIRLGFAFSPRNIVSRGPHNINYACFHTKSLKNSHTVTI